MTNNISPMPKSDQNLIKIWDHVEHERREHGEQAAEQLTQLLLETVRKYRAQQHEPVQA